MWNVPDWVLHEMGIPFEEFVMECPICGRLFFGDLIDQEYGMECTTSCWIEGNILGWDESMYYVELEQNRRFLDRLNVREFGDI